MLKGRSWRSRRPCAGRSCPRIKDGAVVFDGLMLDSSRYDCIKIIACGSSYHVGMVGKYNLEKLTRMPVEVILASEFRYCSPDCKRTDACHYYQPVRRDA